MFFLSLPLVKIVKIPSSNINKHTDIPVRLFIRAISSLSIEPNDMSIERCRVRSDATASAYPIVRIRNSELSGVARRRKAPTPEHVEAMSDNSLERSRGNRRSSYGENMFRILAG